MADNNFTPSFPALASKDIVGRAGDAAFRRPQESCGRRNAASQGLDKGTVLHMFAEHPALAAGEHAVAYREGSSGAGDANGGGCGCN